MIMKRCLLLMLLCFSVSAFASVPLIVPALVGGLDIPAVKQCRAAVKPQCRRQKIPPKYFSCLKEQMIRRPICQQNLAVYKATTGFIEKILHYSAVDVVYTSMMSADYSGEYYLISRRGQVLSPIAKLNIKKASHYALIKRHYPKVALWPIVIDEPNAIKAKNGDQLIIFQQLLMNGCFACERAGVAIIAYRFSPDGEYKGCTLLRLVICN